MGHAACEVMLESKASCEDDQKKQVQGVKKKKWAPSEALEDVLSLPALKKEVMRECSKLSTNLLDR